MLQLLYPPKCVLCGHLLKKNETDLCHTCREDTPVFQDAKNNLSFLAGWDAMWYYKDNVRHGILSYKFYRKRNRASGFGRLLAMHLYRKNLTDFDLLTWAPISASRKAKRGYDQVQLFGKAVGKELNLPLTRTLKKIRNTPSQSGLATTAERRANVLGAYRVTAPGIVRGKRILLLDDVITTGATVSECARMLLTAGAKEVYCVALAAAQHDNKHSR